MNLKPGDQRGKWLIHRVTEKLVYVTRVSRGTNRPRIVHPMPIGKFRE